MNLHPLKVGLNFRPSKSQALAAKANAGNKSAPYQSIDAAHSESKMRRKLALIQ